MQASQRATIYDVAEKAGVSISTVSLSLNKPQRVAESTRAKVFDAVTLLDFRPKAEASIRARRGLGRIAVVAPFSAHVSFYDRLSGILSASENEDVEIVVYDHPSVDTMSSPLLTSLPLRGSVDGLIVLGIPLDLERFESTVDVPVVVVGFEHPSFDSVLDGETIGGRQAGQHLLESGCIDFCYVGAVQASMAYQSPNVARLEGYRAALSAAGHHLGDDRTLAVSLTDRPAAMAAITELITKLDRPSAVLAYNDYLAALAIQSCIQAGLSVPGDLRVAGFDNSEVAEAMGITSVQVPFLESGRHAFEILVHRLSNPDQPTQYTRLGQQVVVRPSTGVRADTNSH